MELSKYEELALLKAYKTKVDERYKEVEAELKDELIADYAEKGVDRLAVKCCDVKVGSMSVAVTKPEPVIKADMMDAAIDWLVANDLAEVVPKKGWQDHVVIAGESVMDKETGELLDWAIVNPSRVKSVMVRGCKPQDVLDAMAPKLNGIDAAKLLGVG